MSNAPLSVVPIAKVDGQWIKVKRWAQLKHFLEDTSFYCQISWFETLKLMAHNWKKWKRVFLTCPCHEIYREEAVGLKSGKYTWNITIVVKFGAISWKFDILSITA